MYTYYVKTKNGELYHSELGTLQHHGIEGQKWGVRNGPPYPLHPEQKSDVERGFLDPVTETILLSTAATAAMVAIRLGVNWLINEGIPNLKHKIGKIKGNKKLDARIEEMRKCEVDKKTGLRIKRNQNSTIKEDAAAINPLFKSKAQRFTNNCVMCSMSYDLRRRGFEVYAKGREHGLTDAQITECYKPPKDAKYMNIPHQGRISTGKRQRLINDTILKACKGKEGARGLMGLVWEFGSGHSIAWEIKNGQVVYIDGQSNKVSTKIPNLQYVSQHWANSVNFMRTDTLTPDYAKMKKEAYIGYDPYDKQRTGNVNKTGKKKVSKGKR